MPSNKLTLQRETILFYWNNGTCSPKEIHRLTARKLTQDNINMSYKTVGRRLHELGYKNSLPIGTPMLTAIQKEKRVEWAQNHLNDSWKKTLFTMKLPSSYSEIPLNIGKTSLFCFTQIMNAEFYVEILQNHIPEVRRMLGRRWRFQQDNDRKHTSRRAKEFLQENVPKFSSGHQTALILILLKIYGVLSSIT
ncbi:uncharacterized protein LOC114254052 [Rhizophagus clarus]|uniref:Uncharacterized protein LOC114254052 n=1 Tax=Rhizophagus clarus TaxID=94130 RepID=A0A8H3QHT2_9GLOM|nr:uncharacterized protein LOC114254052 [Rhizophagus clarus]